ncbi:neurotrimin isoform X2 [Amia ocellicauda]|uniref:neurotrimin isoform X2 n=1 Tax=Amia ocellicauda TaxID=2972642 RepID=UPI0034646AFD
MHNPVCWVILTGMTALILHQGVLVRSGESQADNRVLDNITIRQGDTVILRCPQDNVVTHTAWLNRSSILYAGEDKWSVDPRVSLILLNQREYTIKIEKVDVSDEGLYTCAVQTRSSPRTTSVHVIVQVPPKITKVTKDMSVNEGTNVTLMCFANGKPEPTITWRHLSPLAQGPVSEEEYLEIPAITRQRSGMYECNAANEVATDVQKVQVTVNFPPTISDAKDVGVPLGQRGVLQCEAVAVPTADFEWYRDDKRILNGFDGIEVETRGRLSMLTFFNVTEDDYGNYTCVAMNKLGSSNTSIILYEISEPTSSTLLQGPGAVQDGNSGGIAPHPSTCLLIILCVQLLVKL